MAITKPKEERGDPTTTAISTISHDMDFLTGASDHTLSSDILQLDQWTNVLSPNSLHMYDHDKINTLACMPCNLLSITDEFDLQPQYEHSDNILVSCNGSSPLESFNIGNTSVDNNITDWSILQHKEKKKDMDFLEDMSGGNSQLTLSQLNSNYEDTSSQKSFANSINSDDLAVLETMFVRPTPNIIEQIVKEEVPGSSMKQAKITQWIEQTDMVKNQPDKDQTVCKHDISNHGFSPHTHFHPVPVPSSNDVTKTSQDVLSMVNTNLPQTVLSDADGAQALLSLKTVGDRDQLAKYLLHTRDIRKRQISTVTSGSGEKINEKWEEIKQFLSENPDERPILPPGRPKRQRFDSGSTIWTSEYDSSDDNSYHSDDEDSDVSDNSWKAREHVKSSKSRKHSFWQYNLQSKGPKGKRLIEAVPTSDPHVLPEVEDPVFDQTRFNVTLTHGGKARRGDGNDVIPNPKKLYQLGSELKRLIKQINVFSPMNEVPVNIRSKSRKEKNKIASRVCRLRKKAQHEANKVKCYGLEQEHSKLMAVVSDVKLMTYKWLRGALPSDSSQRLTDKVTHIIDSKISVGVQVAGNTVDYVNKVIDKVSAGDNTGGLN